MTDSRRGETAADPSPTVLAAEAARLDRDVVGDEPDDATTWSPELAAWFDRHGAAADALAGMVGGDARRLRQAAGPAPEVGRVEGRGLLISAAIRAERRGGGDTPVTPATSTRARKPSTLADLAQAYVDDRTEGLSPSRRKDVRRILARFTDVVGPMPPRWLGEDHVKQWLATRADRATSTRYHELCAVRAFCVWLAANRYARPPLEGPVWELPERPRRRRPARSQVDTERPHFRQELLERGLSPRTANYYARTVQRAELWCDRQGVSLAQASAVTIIEYAATLPRTFSSLSCLHKALAHYWDLCGREDPPLRAIRVPPRRRMECRALDEDQARRLSDVARARGDDHGLAVVLGLYLALRREEIATLRWDCFGQDGWVTITGKGDVTARIPVHPVAAELLAATERRGPWVFPGRVGGGHVSPATVWGWIRRVADEAGVDGVAPHRLRHTALATALDNTRDLRGTQDFARHADPRVTAGYTRTTKQRLAVVVAAVDYSRRDTDVTREGE
jgi:integrase